VAQSRRYDVIVIGVGGMGSAAVYQLAKRGKRVLGLERFDIPHSMGSSHGVNRIIRLAYYEHPSYVPLLKRAYALWRELEQHVGEQLLYITGSLDAGPEAGQIVQGSRASCAEHNLPHELLTGAEVNQRFPGYRLPADHAAVLQPEGGYLLSERCIVAHVTAAQTLGAEVHARERVLGWEPRSDGIQVTTDHGTFEAERLIVSAGAWVGDLVPGLKPVTSPERQVLAWLQPSRSELFDAAQFPVFNLQVEEGHYYGFPISVVPGFKFGRYHHLDEQVDPETIDREPNLRDEALLREFAERYFPEGAGPTMALRACMFTNAPDEHFILDLHPDDSRVVVASPCSGHGFKFCSVVGEIAADLAEAGETRHDIGLFGIGRFAQGTEMQRIRA
jgi:sarcosine oxidase